MSTKYPYYYIPKDKLCYFVGDRPQCHKCNNMMARLVWVTLNTYKGVDSAERFEHYCQSCKDYGHAKFLEYMKFRNGSYFQRMIIVPSVPYDAMLWDASPQREFVNSKNMTIFDAADKNISGEKINDFTVHAGKTSLEGAQIGKLEHEVPTKDKVLNDDEVDALLDFHLNAPTALPEPEKQHQLEE